MAEKLIIVPISPEAGWDQIHYNELYKGPVEVNPPAGYDNSRKVPRVGWWVVSEDAFYLVTRVFADNTSELTGFRPGGAGDDEDVITGPTTHQWISPFRVMVDPTRTPVQFRIDDYMEFNGSEPVYYKVFLGTNISSSGKVISTAVNGSGKPTDANLMLELVKGPNSTYKLVKAAKGGHLLELVADQEVVTVVAYTAAGLVSAYRPARVVHTTNIAPLDQAKLIVRSIALETMYLSADDDSLIEYPLNMRVESSGIMGVVTYNNGAIVRLPINGSKFKLDGHQDFLATVPGPMTELGLSYTLSDDEVAWNAIGNIPQRSVTRKYMIRAIEADGNYSVKIFVVPYWDATLGGYKLRYFLYNMKRDLIREVTQYIEMTPGFIFDGKVYNRKQDLRFAINMKNLGASYQDYRHVQNVSVLLTSPAITPGQATYFQLYYSDQYTYGLAIRADATANPNVTGQTNLNIAFNATTVDEWTERVYRSVEPLYFTQGETIPPNPTTVTIRDLENTWRREISIDDVLKPISGLTATFNQGSTLVLEFSATTSEGKQELALANMVINRL